MVPHSRRHFWLIVSLTVMGFGLAVLGCYLRFSSVVELGFFSLGLMQLVAIHSALKAGQLLTNFGLETKQKTPVGYWCSMMLFGLMAVGWTTFSLWALVTGHDMFKS